MLHCLPLSETDCRLIQEVIKEKKTLKIKCLIFSNITKRQGTPCAWKTLRRQDTDDGSVTLSILNLAL